MPFAKGRRGCLGKHIATAELYLSIAILVRRFAFEMVDTVRERDWMVSRATVVGSVGRGSRGVMVRARGADGDGEGGD